MAIGCFAGFIFDIDKTMLTLISLSLATILLIAVKKLDVSTKAKVGLIYGHLIMLSLPLVLLTTNFACGTMCMSCYTDTAAMLGYALPSAVALGTLAGFVVIPVFFFSTKTRSKNKDLTKFVLKYSRMLGIKPPGLYVIDKAKPVAFSFRSFRSAIFVSVGMLDVLTKKEVQAVLLHEIAHIKNTSSVLKVSSLLMRLSPLSLLAGFHGDIGREERRADKFAAKMQGTNRHVSSAKKKIEKF